MATSHHTAVLSSTRPDGMDYIIVERSIHCGLLTKRYATLSIQDATTLNARSKNCADSLFRFTQHPSVKYSYV